MAQALNPNDLPPSIKEDFMRLRGIKLLDPKYEKAWGDYQIYARSLTLSDLNRTGNDLKTWVSKATSGSESEDALLLMLTHIDDAKTKWFDRLKDENVKKWFKRFSSV